MLFDGPELSCPWLLRHLQLRAGAPSEAAVDVASICPGMLLPGADPIAPAPPADHRCIGQPAIPC